MFCPKCKAEYQPGFSRCGDCDMPLVEHLSGDLFADARTQESDYVAVTSVAGQLEADQIRSFLEAHGIPTEVPEERFRNAYGIQVPGIASLQILVPRDLSMRACDLLAQAARGDLTLDSTEE